MYSNTSGATKCYNCPLVHATHTGTITSRLSHLEYKGMYSNTSGATKCYNCPLVHATHTGTITSRLSHLEYKGTRIDTK